MNKGGEIFFDDLEIFEGSCLLWYFEQSWPTPSPDFARSKNGSLFHVYYRLSAGKRRQAASASGNFQTQTKRRLREKRWYRQLVILWKLRSADSQKGK
ncbi:MAG: hypothetical protein V8T87_06915 [Victivallales bacterium]